MFYLVEKSEFLIFAAVFKGRKSLTFRINKLLSGQKTTAIRRFPVFIN